MSETTTIYVLHLEGGRYYVGKTDDDINTRLTSHFNGNGAAWTKKYQPLNVVSVEVDKSNFDEDRITKELMAIHGIDNVRGGTYVQIVLDEGQKKALQTEIWGAQNKCANCGEHGHYIKDCRAETNEVWMRIGTAEEEEEEEDHIAEAECYRCGRPGHFIAKCYAKTHANGLDLKLSGKKPDSASSVKEPSSTGKRKAEDAECLRCGRPGHLTADCYARTHASDYPSGPSKAKRETTAMAKKREAEATALAAAVAVAMAAAQEAARREAAAAAASKRKAVAVAMAAAQEAARREAEAAAVAAAVAVAMAAAREAARREAAAAAASKRKAVAVAALCLRCGRSGHVIAQCYARTQASGSDLKSSTKVPSAAAKREAAAAAVAAVAVAAAVAAVAAAEVAKQKNVPKKPSWNPSWRRK
jgi:predicted GIY-YIG superfamily endonuclease